MDLLSEVKQILTEGENFTKTNNFFFEKHMCVAKNELLKVELKHTVRDNNTDDITNFGICPACKTVFYHEASSETPL